MTIAEMNRRWGPIDVYTLGVESVLSDEDLILDTIKEQMDQGKMPDNTSIRPEYSWESYANFKYNMNRKAGYATPDLRLTGNLERARKIEIRGKNSFVVISNDEKYSILVSKYGQFYGLSNAGVQLVGEKVQYDFILRLKQTLYG